MESRQCTKCKKTLLLDLFRMHQRTGQYTKYCINCLDNEKKYIEKNKCKHGKQRPKCKDPECDGGGAFCNHGKQRYQCRDPQCEGGGSFCKHHNIQKSNCRDPLCGGGGSFCTHNKIKYQCPICDPIGHLASIVRSRIWKALKGNKELHSTEYTQCTTEQLREHIEAQFKEGMSWQNYGEWHVDHRIPLAYKQDGIPPTFEEIAKRLHYTNTQLLWASKNWSKGNRYIS